MSSRFLHAKMPQNAQKCLENTAQIMTEFLQEYLVVENVQINVHMISILQLYAGTCIFLQIRICASHVCEGDDAYE